jgi:surface-anchored protein
MNVLQDFRLRIVLGLVGSVFLTEAWAGHVHVQVTWREGTLGLEVYDFDEGSFPPHQYQFLIGHAGMVQVPNNPAFGFLGDPHSTVFVLPQTGHPDLVHLGIGVDPVPDGILAGNRIRLRLTHITGPGRFHLYQVGSLGAPWVLFGGLEGDVGGADDLEFASGAHEHYNWAFSAPGNYQLTFLAEGTQVADGLPIVSQPGTFWFRVLAPHPSSIVLDHSTVGAWRLQCQSRAGARLELLESINLETWEPVTTELLLEAIWEVELKARTGGHRYWRVAEIFP